MGVAVVKLIGALFKIPIVNILGEEGYADFSNAYNIYTVLLTVSTAGLPVALSKLVSEANTLNRRNQVARTFRVALATFLVLGAISFCVMFFFAPQLANLLNDSRAVYSIRVLSPAVVCVGCLAAFRGYAQGHGRMTPTAVSQIIEALCKLIIGLALATVVVGLPMSTDTLASFQPELDISALSAEEAEQAIATLRIALAAAAAIAGVTIGTVLALAYMILNYASSKLTWPSRGTDRPDSSGSILGTLLSIAIPITLSTSMVGIITLIDSSLVQGQLQNALHMSEDASRGLYGSYSGVMTLYNLPSSVMTALTAAIVPAISACLARRDRRGATGIATSSLRVTGLIAFPMGIGLCVLAKPIVALLFPRLDMDLSGSLLSVLGIASIFVCLMLVTNSILQANGFINLPIVTMLIGGVVKIIINYNLVAVPDINIHGAPVGTLSCFALTALLNLALLARVMPGPVRYASAFAKPLIASLLMGAAAWGSYGLLHRILSGITAFQRLDEATDAVLFSRTGYAVAVFASIAVAGCIYLVLVVALRAISREDLALMPKGEKIARILHI